MAFNGSFVVAVLATTKALQVKPGGELEGSFVVAVLATTKALQVKPGGELEGSFVVAVLATTKAAPSQTVVMLTGERVMYAGVARAEYIGLVRRTR